VILSLGKLDIGRVSKQVMHLLHCGSVPSLPLLDLLALDVAVLDLTAQDLAVMVLYVVAQLKSMCH
jgi:hypothetical protein